MEYADFDLQLGPRIGESLHVQVLRSPAGAGAAQVPLAPLLELAGAHHQPPAAVGTALFQMLFQGRVGNLFHASLHSLQKVGPQSGLRLRLHFGSDDPDLVRLLQVPWELLYRPETEDFLALHPATPVVRSVDIPKPAVLPPFEPPLRLLAVSGAQDPTYPLDLAGELRQLEKTLRGNPEIEVEPLTEPEPQALRDALAAQPFHVLHYMGHGVFDDRTGSGSLLWRDAGGGSRPLDGRHLATKLRGIDSLRLVVLNACDTARAGGAAGRDPFAGVATALVLAGIPAVVAMQSPIDDAYALVFSAAFYRQLARGRSVEEAMAEGRQAIYSQGRSGADWAVPVLFLRTAGDLTSPQVRTAPPRRWRARAALAAGLAGALAAAPWAPWDRFFEPEVLPPAPTEPLTRPEPTPPVVTEKTPAPRPAPPPPRATETILVGDGLRFRVTADSRVGPAFGQALRTAAEPLPGFGMSGQTIRVDVQTPQIESSTEAGLPAVRCRLAATCRLESGATVLIAPVSLEQGNETAACEAAAEELARIIADRLASST